VASLERVKDTGSHWQEKYYEIHRTGIRQGYCTISINSASPDFFIYFLNRINREKIKSGVKSHVKASGVTRYCRIDQNGTVLSVVVMMIIPIQY
jgi:hypothetical protein